jgi:hypothetical protein
LIVLLSACSSGNSTSGAQQAVANAIQTAADKATETVAGVSDSDEWAADVENSSIDGQVAHAKRNYAFADRGTWFAVDLKCIEANGSVGLSIESYEGDPTSSSPGSAFATKIVTNLFGGVVQIPVGRAKPSGLDVEPLSGLFRVSDTVSNRIELVRPGIYDDVIRLPEGMQGVNANDINFVRVVRDMLPLSLELNNSLGTSEVVIDPSPQVLQTLRVCGGDSDLVAPEAVARLQEEKLQQEEQKRAAEEQAAAQAAQQAEHAQAQEAEARAEIGLQCRSNGDARQYLGGKKVDCTTDFPDEMAAFNAEIDAIFAVPTKHGFLCSSRGTRDDLVNFANQRGLDAARAYVQQNWCGNLLKVDK